MNILILSCGTRNKIVQYFRNSLYGKGNVIATDMSPYAPALYEADRFYIVPRITDPGYLDVIFNICINENIQAVLSLIDPELSLLAQNIENFRNIGVTVIGSDFELCERALDKIKMYEWCIQHNYRCAKSYVEINTFYKDLNSGNIGFPVFVKPIRGSASLSVSRVEDYEMLELMFERNENLMIQQYLNGQEIGADVYIDMISGEVVSIFTKKKLVMRAGETDKAVSFKDRKLFDIIKCFAEESGFRGQIDIDIFEVDGEYYISEINPRFGGGYPHAYECGVNHIKLILNNLQGIINSADIGNYESDIVMMKYNEIRTIKL